MCSSIFRYKLVDISLYKEYRDKLSNALEITRIRLMLYIHSICMNMFMKLTFVHHLSSMLICQKSINIRLSIRAVAHDISSYVYYFHSYYSDLYNVIYVLPADNEVSFVKIELTLNLYYF